MDAKLRDPLTTELQNGGAELPGLGHPHLPNILFNPLISNATRRRLSPFFSKLL